MDVGPLRNKRSSISRTNMKLVARAMARQKRTVNSGTLLYKNLLYKNLQEACLGQRGLTFRFYCSLFKFPVTVLKVKESS